MIVTVLVIPSLAQTVRDRAIDHKQCQRERGFSSVTGIHTTTPSNEDPEDYEDDGLTLHLFPGARVTFPPGLECLWIRPQLDQEWLPSILTDRIIASQHHSSLF